MKKEKSWRELISQEMGVFGESFSDAEHSTLSPEDLDEKFDPGYGGIEGLPFTLWTERRVYFPVVYDGLEWVASVSRNPDGKPTEHVGGG